MTPRSRVTVFAAVATLLGSLSLMRLYSNLEWFPPVLLIVATIAVTSLVAHRVRALAVAAPLILVAVFACVITAMYAHAVAPLGFVPGPAAIRHLHSLTSAGFTDTTQMAAPVSETPGLALLTTGGIGLVAVLVETLATTLRRPAVAGLALLAIFTVPAAILSAGVGWLPFAFATAGYLALLLAEGRDRVSRWGRPVHTRRGPDAFADPAASSADRGMFRRRATATAELTSAGRRIGATSIAVALVAPLIIPGLHAGWFGTHHTNGAGGIQVDGNGPKISPIVTLRRDLNEPVPVSEFTYTTDRTAGYFRLLTLDTFDGTTWTASAIASPEDTPIDEGLAVPVGIALPPDSVTTQVHVTGLTEPFLPAPALPVEVDAKGDWTYNPVTTTIYSAHLTTRKNFNYGVISNVYSPSPAFLGNISEGDASLSNKYLQVPAGLPANIQSLTDQIVTSAHAAGPYATAVALQNYFLKNFTYDLHAKSGNSTSALESFLKDRTGYCEQFAATMALMARLEGIPSRVDVGFTSGTRIPGTNSYEVTSADAHAWPELYFPGAGWLRFEPTPRSDNQAVQPGYAAAGVAPNVTISPGSTATHAPVGVPSRALGQPGAAGGSKGTTHHGFRFAMPDISPEWLALIALAFVLVLVTPAVRWWVRRRRWTAADTAAAEAHAAWEELGDDLRDLRLEWSGDYDSPRRAAGALLATRRLHYDQAAQLALTRLTRAEELARYATADAADSRLADLDLRTDEAAIRKALFDSVPKLRRLRARLVPGSTGRAFAAASSALQSGASRTVERIASRLLPERRGNGD